MSIASPYLDVLSLPFTAHRACRSNQWLQRSWPFGALAAFLCLGVVCMPGKAQVTQLPAWTEQNPTTSPTVRLYAPMAYDAAAGNVVLFGGA